jgi:hypothetical protein
MKSEVNDMLFDKDCNYERFNVECDSCPMVLGGFNGQVLKEYVNTYLINLDMNSLCSKDKSGLMNIKEFNGRIVIAKKFVSPVGQQVDDQDQAKFA